jgi:hypothetical protein
MEVAVQRFDERRWVAFHSATPGAPPVCVGTGPTREAAAQSAVVRSGHATAAEVLAQARTQEAAAPSEAVTLTPDIRRWFNLPSAADMLGVDPAATWAWEPLRWAYSAPPVGLRPYQAWVLFNAAVLRDRGLPGKGLVVSAGVGQGKTLIGFLLGATLGVSPGAVAVLVPAALEGQWRDDANRYRAMGFNLPPTPAIITHETVGAATRNPLQTLNPAVVIIDEASAFANGESTRTRRLLSWKASAPNARVFPMSATYLKASLQNVAHLLAMTLGELAPLPTHYPDLRAVASAVDADARLKRYAPGVLLQRTPPEARGLAPLQQARAAVRALMADRAGYLRVPDHMAAEGETAAPLSYTTLRPEPPEKILKALRTLEQTWEHPQTGEVYTEALAIHRAASELSAGYWTEWTPAAPFEWAAARKEAAKAVRAAAKLRQAGMPDSAGAWARALRKPPRTLPHRVPVEVDRATGTPRTVDLREVWATWQSAAIRHGTTTALAGPFPGQTRDFHPLDPYLVEWAAAWARDGGAGLIWTRSPDFGAWVANVAGCPYYGTGPGGEGVRSEDGTRCCVVSVQVHHRGKNLQQWHRNLVLQPFGSADVLEQLTGRTHRAGQRHPVTLEFAAPTPYQDRAIAAALRRSRFVHEIGEASYRLWRFGHGLEFDRRALEDPSTLADLEGEEP